MIVCGIYRFFIFYQDTARPAVCLEKSSYKNRGKLPTNPSSLDYRGTRHTHSSTPPRTKKKLHAVKVKQQSSKDSGDLV